jgi:riboflavin biosynthesis pyrimidine reductase
LDSGIHLPRSQGSVCPLPNTVLRKPAHPLVVIISGSGRLDLDREIFRTPEVCVVIITTPSGQDRLVKAGATGLAAAKVRTLEAPNRSVDPEAMLHLLFSDFGVRALLYEGGPTLFGQFLRRTLVDELFMTLAPQIAGRLPQTTRPGLAAGMEFLPDTAPWFQLVSVTKVQSSVPSLPWNFEAVNR